MQHLFVIGVVGCAAFFIGRRLWTTVRQLRRRQSLSCGCGCSGCTLDDGGSKPKGTLPIYRP